MAYENLFEMVKDILAYVEDHPGCVVLSSDDPWSRRIGFCVPPTNSWHVRVRNFLSRWVGFLEVKPGVLWEIGLPKLRSSIPIADGDGVTRVQIMEYLSTPSGRIKLASSLTAGINPLVSR
jgi:hypothetical protein